VRVLLVDLELDWRGGQSQALLLLRGLRARGHDAELLSVNGAALAERTQKADIAIYLTGAAARNAQAAWSLRKLLRQRKFDVIHANEPHALTAAWLARAQRVAPLVAARRVVFPLRRSRVSLARYQAASRIIAISPAVRSELLAAGLDAARIEVIPDGIEAAAPITADERARSRTKWGIATDAPVAGYVASLTVEKGHDLLLDAFAEISRALPACHLLLAGSGVLQRSLQEKARASGLSPRVHFLGFVDEPRQVYAASDAVLFPGRREGLGSSLLDAMSCGLPVVALEGTATAAVLEDGRDGLVVAPLATLLAGAAARLLRDQALRIRLGEAARRKVTEQFSADRMVDATVCVYQSLVSRR
jgi:glycosyltransferase involved in cell wall biosynthesis